MNETSTDQLHELAAPLSGPAEPVAVATAPDPARRGRTRNRVVAIFAAAALLGGGSAFALTHSGSFSQGSTQGPGGAQGFGNGGPGGAGGPGGMGGPGGTGTPPDMTNGATGTAPAGTIAGAAAGTASGSTVAAS